MMLHGSTQAGHFVYQHKRCRHADQKVNSGKAGYTVTQACDLRQVKTQCEGHSFSVAVLGQSLNQSEKKRITDVVLKSCKFAKILISDQSPTPILTGEDIYLKEPFRALCERHAVSKIHPDLATAGGNSRDS